MPQLWQMGVKNTMITGLLSGQPALAKAANGPAELRLLDAVNPKAIEQAG